MKPENKDRYICPFPDCHKVFWKSKDEIDACPEHRKLVKDVFFIFKTVREIPKTPSGIIIPKSGIDEKDIKNLFFQRRPR